MKSVIQREIKLENFIEFQNIKQEIKHCKKELKECQNYNPFKQALSKIDPNKYGENYDCLNFTRDLQEELRKLNIESSIFINKNRDHAWLAVWIESTKGEFIGINREFELLEVRDNEMKVICK